MLSTDITVAMFKSGNLTIYEPNMHRVDVEDVKGLEVVLLLGATVIKDVFFNANREMFNISSPQATKPNRTNSGPHMGSKPSRTPPVVMSGGVVTGPQRQNYIPASQIPHTQPARPQQHQQQSLGPPHTNPRTQWEIDAETERLKKVVEAEEREREKADKIEQKRIKKMLEAEEKERKRKDAEVAKETERLRKQYGVSGADLGPPRVQFTPPAMPPRPQQPQHHSISQQRPQYHQQSPSNHQQTPQQLHQYQSAPHSRPVPVKRPVSAGVFNLTSLNNMLGGASSSGSSGKPHGQSGPYLQAPGSGTASSSGFFGLGSGKKVQKKRSVYF